MKRSYLSNVYFEFIDLVLLQKLHFLLPVFVCIFIFARSTKGLDASVTNKDGTVQEE